jgi:hypothetical protein
MVDDNWNNHGQIYNRGGHETERHRVAWLRQARGEATVMDG